MTPTPAATSRAEAKPTIRRFKASVTTEEYPDGSVLLQVNGHDIISLDISLLPHYGLTNAAEASPTSTKGDGGELAAKVEAAQELKETIKYLELFLINHPRTSTTRLFQNRDKTIQMIREWRAIVETVNEAASPPTDYTDIVGRIEKARAILVDLCSEAQAYTYDEMGKLWYEQTKKAINALAPPNPKAATLGGRA